MQERTLKVLEFNKIKDKLKDYAITTSSKEMIDKLQPYETIYEVRKKLKETDEALDLLITKGNPPFEGLHDVKEGVERAKKGGVLSPGQLLKIGGMLKCSRNFKNYISRREDETAHLILEDLAYILTPIKNLEDTIEISIISEEEISDRASCTLNSIRRNLK